MVKRLSTMWETWVGKFPGEGNGNPLQYSCLENPMDRGAWCPWGRKESDTTERLHFTSFHMYIYIYSATYFFSSLIIVWGFPGGTMVKILPATCRRNKRYKLDPRVRKIPWRGAWQPTPVFLPGESHGQRSLAGLQSTGLYRVEHD